MRRNVVNGMMGLCIAAAFGLAGCGGGGDGGTLAPVQTQAEIDAAKLATLKKVEGSWTFNYTVGFPFTDKLTLRNVKKISLSSAPTLDYEVTVTPNSSSNIMLGAYSSTEDTMKPNVSWIV